MGRDLYRWRHYRIRNTVRSSPSGCITTGIRASLGLLIIKCFVNWKRRGKQRCPDGRICAADAEHAAVDLDHKKEGEERLSVKEPRYDQKQEERETADHQGGFKWRDNSEDSPDEVPILG